MAVQTITLYHMQGGNTPARDDAPWTAIWLGHLGGFWELILTDERGDTQHNQMTSADTGHPHPLDGRLEALGVEFVPGSEWVSQGLFRFERPIRPWKRRPGAPEEEEAPEGGVAGSLSVP